MLYASKTRYRPEIVEDEPSQMPPLSGHYRVIDVANGMVVAVVSEEQFFAMFEEVPEEAVEEVVEEESEPEA